jgi:hypothetical protein
MKSLATLILAVTLLAFTGNVSADEKTYVPKDNEEFYGTWVNTEYYLMAQKVVINPDGTWGWTMSASDEPVTKYTYELKEKWTDSKGNIWYKVRLQSQRGKDYVLVKLSNSGNTREIVWDSHEYPMKIDSKNANYRIYYRQ